MGIKVVEVSGLLLALLLSGGSATAEEVDCSAADAYDVVDAFDPDAEVSKRQQALYGLKTYAQCPEPAYALAQLYRHGSDLPGNLIQKDVNRAKELLVLSAEAGRHFAYADLAEVALKEDEPRDAMKWVQVYLYFAKTRDAFDPKRGSFDRSGYNANLLSRAEHAWQVAKLPREWIGTDLNGYLSSREQAVSTAISKFDAEVAEVKSGQQAPGELRIKDVRICHAEPRWSGYASYLIEVYPDGKTGRIVLENYSPEPGMGKDLIGCARVIDFHPFEGTSPHTIRIPVLTGYAHGRQLKVKRK